MPEKRFVNSLKFLSIIWTVGLFLVTSTYFLLHKNLIFYDVIFWAGILLSGLSTYAVISSNYSINAKLVFLFLFGLVLYMPHTLSSPDYFHTYDESIHYSTTSSMYDTGSIYVSSSFIISAYYPTLEILTIYFKHITGSTIFNSGTIIIGIIHSFTIIFLYLFFRNICSEKIASIGTFAYFFNSSYTHFDTYFSYESVGLPLLIISLFAISFRFDDTTFNSINKTEISFIHIILILGVVVTHHFSSYILLLFMIILLILKVVNHKNMNDRKIKALTFLIGTLIFGWMLYVATILITYYNVIFRNAIKGVIDMTLYEDRVTEILSEQFLDIPYYELFIRRFVYVPLVLILIFIAIYYLYSHKKIYNNYILTLITFCGMFFLYLFGVMTSSFEFGRFLTYGFIGIAFLIGISIERMQKVRFLRIITPVIIIFLLIGGISIGISSPYRGSYSDDIRIGQQTITKDSIYSAAWFEKYMGRYNAIISDIATGTVFKYYGHQATKEDSVWEVYFPLNVDDGVLSNLMSNEIDYIMVDNRMTRSISELRYYFDRKELYIKDHPSYGRTEPIPTDSIRKFDDTSIPIFLKIYDNGNINIYRVMRYNIDIL